MTKPLALVLYENLLPGSQLVNRLTDMGYRVFALTDPGRLGEEVMSRKPMLLIVDLYSSTHDVCEEIGRLKKQEATSHLPVLAITPNDNQFLRETALGLGARLVVADDVILHHLPQFLDQVLEVD